MMTGKVQTKSYPVEERLDMIWVWIGDMEPVAVEEDLAGGNASAGRDQLDPFHQSLDRRIGLFFSTTSSTACTHPTCIGFRRSLRSRRLPVPGWSTASPDFTSSNMTTRPWRPLSGARAKNTEDWSSRWIFPVWENFRSTTGGASVRLRLNRRPTLCPVSPLAPFSMCCRPTCTRFTKPLFHPIHYPDRSLSICITCAPSPVILKASISLWWKFYFKIFSVTHDKLFIGQDHRVLRSSTFGPEQLSPLDQDIIYWRKFAVRNARGYMKSQKTLGKEMAFPDESEEFNMLREAF